MCDNPKPGFKWPVTASRTISASAWDVRQAISLPGNLEPCHPYLRRESGGSLAGGRIPDGMPVIIHRIPHMLSVGPMLRKYLSYVIRGFEWYVTRGETVPRNQFGSYPWFSPRKPLIPANLLTHIAL